AGSRSDARTANGFATRKWVVCIDALAVVAAVFAVLSVGWRGSLVHPTLGRFFAGPTLYRSLLVFAAAVVLRLATAYPPFLQRITDSKNVIDHLSRSRRGESAWLRVAWIGTSLVIWLAILAVMLAVFADWTSFGLPAVLGTFFDAAKTDLLVVFFVLAILGRFAIAYPPVFQKAAGAKNLD